MLSPSFVSCSGRMQRGLTAALLPGPLLCVGSLE